MDKFLSMFDEKGWFELRNQVQLFRKSFLESGGDPVDFPKFLEENGIKANGFLITVDDRASALEQFLKD
jgi:hypothetical protein